jgi:hypothetical protein
VETSLAIPDFHHPNRGFSLLKTGIQIWILVIQQCQPWEFSQPAGYSEKGLRPNSKTLAAKWVKTHGIRFCSHQNDWNLWI